MNPKLVSAAWVALGVAVAVPATGWFLNSGTREASRLAFRPDGTDLRATDVDTALRELSQKLKQVESGQSALQGMAVVQDAAIGEVRTKVAQVGHADAFLLERRLELLVVLELVLLADPLDDALELFVGHAVAALLALLHDQDLVDGVDDDLRGHLVEGLLQLGVVLEVERTGVPVLGAQRLDLALFDLALGQDVAVDLHDDLLEDLGTEPDPHEHGERGDE
jgi:hypothetical protein